MSVDADTGSSLARVVADLPGGERRDGQALMADAVARAITDRRHLVVQAGTGTGKSLAYLVPVVLSGQTTVVATATKALQDQMTTKDLPFLRDHLDGDLEWAVLKGRSNYLCLQRVREVRDGGQGELELDRILPSTKREIELLAAWAGHTATGDRAELDWNPSTAS